jgi:hypothetical protein
LQNSRWEAGARGRRRELFGPSFPPKRPPRGRVGAWAGPRGSTTASLLTLEATLGGFWAPQGRLQGPDPGVGGPRGGARGPSSTFPRVFGGAFGGHVASFGFPRSNLPAFAGGFGYHQGGLNPGGDPRAPVAHRSHETSGTSWHSSSPRTGGIVGCFGQDWVKRLGILKGYYYLSRGREGDARAGAGPVSPRPLSVLTYRNR